MEVPDFKKPITGKGVELQHMIGVRKSRGEVITVPYPVDYVYIEGIRVGLVSRSSDCIICFYPNITEDEFAYVHKEVTRLRVELGKNIPAQEGRLWSAPPNPHAIKALTDKKKDASLIDTARERYGLTEDSKPEPVPPPQKGSKRATEAKREAKAAKAKAREESAAKARHSGTK